MVLGVIDSPQPQYTVLAKKASYEIRRYILAKVSCLKAHNRATFTLQGALPKVVLHAMIGVDRSDSMHTARSYGSMVLAEVQGKAANKREFDSAHFRVLAQVIMPGCFLAALLPCLKHHPKTCNQTRTATQTHRQTLSVALILALTPSLSLSLCLLLSTSISASLAHHTTAVKLAV